MKKIFLLSLFCLIFPLISFAYDDENTHPGITEQVVEFYNLNNNIKISSSDKELIIQGSIDEDNNPKTRPLNHFYEPQRQMGINNYRNAIEWVTEANNGNDFTWAKSIAKYARGDRKGALIGLGHILHLAEDMTVPDHTRNDPHMGTEGLAVLANTGDSLYENWAKEHKTRTAMKGVAQEYKNLNYKIRRAGDNIESYFEDLANYSNNNYVSPDTINGVYSDPEVVEKKNGYAYGEDNYFYDKHKLYIESILDGGEVVQSLVNVKTNNTSVLEDYFNRLAKMAILSGAGITEMFMREAEEARTSYLEAEAKKQAEVASLEALRLARINESNIFTGLWYRLSYAVTDTVSAISGIISNTVTDFASSIYSGSALVLNNTRNFVNGVAYTGNELASIGAQAVEKTVSSVSKKVVLYIKENSQKLITPAAAYTLSEPALTDDQMSQLVAILNSPIVQDIINEQTGQSQKVANAENHHNSAPKIIVPVATSTISTTTEDITATSTVVKDEEPPEVFLNEIAECSASLSDDICLLLATSSSLINFSWNSSSTDIDFYTVTVTDGLEDIVMATTSENNASVSFDTDSEYEIKISATDLAGNVSDISKNRLAFSSHPVVINEMSFKRGYWVSLDEWLELYNSTDYEINLDNMSLSVINREADSYVALSGKIEPNGYYLLERTDDQTVSNVQADLIYTQTLVFDNEILSLNLASSSIDMAVINNPDYWIGVSHSSKGTVERKRDDVSGLETKNWYVNLREIFNGKDINGLWISGTPRVRNCYAYLLNGGENIMNDMTITKDQGVQVIISSSWKPLTVKGNLTLEPGVIIEFASGALFITGGLISNGTAEEPVIISVLANDLNGLDLDPSDIKPNIKWGTWSGLEGDLIFGPNSSSTIENTIIKNIKGVKVDDAKLEADNLSYLANGNNSIFIENGSEVNIRDSVFDSNNGGFYIDTGSTLNMSDVVVDNTASVRIENIYAYGSSTVTVSDINMNGINGGAFYIEDNSHLYLENANINLVGDVHNGITIRNGSDAVIDQVKISGTDDYAQVVGAWSDVCSSSSPRSSLEISNSEFSNGEEGLWIGSCIDANLSNVSVSGFSREGIIVDDDAYLTATGLDITENNIGVFVYPENTEIHVTDSNIAGNETGVLVDEGLPPVELDFSNNWWGDASGPANPTTNPSGLGDSVTDEIDFSPPLTEEVK